MARYIAPSFESDDDRPGSFLSHRLTHHLIPGSRLALIPGAGRLATPEKPGALARRLAGAGRVFPQPALAEPEGVVLHLGLLAQR